MRRLAGLVLVPVLLLSVAACGDDKASDSTSDSSSAAGQMKDGLPAVTAGEKFGEKPTLAKGTGTPVKQLKVNVLSKGTDQKVVKGDQIEVNYLGQAWDSDKPFDNSFDRGEPFKLTLGAGEVIPGWEQGLEGQQVGSRVEIGIPPELGYGAQGQGDIKPNATLVFVVDILKATTVPKSAEGTDVPQTDASLPKVGTNTDGKAPSLSKPEGDAPTKLISNYVIEGKGEPVKSTDTLTVNYQGVLWKDGKKFDSSYDRGAPASFSLAGVIPGWTKGLEGKKVGSRVLLVVPPDQGYGDQAQGPIPAKSTLVFTVDILAKG